MAWVRNRHGVLTQLPDELAQTLVRAGSHGLTLVEGPALAAPTAEAAPETDKPKRKPRKKKGEA